MNTVMKQKKASWHGPRQIFMMVFTGLLMFFQTTVVTASTNTVIPLLSTAKGYEQTPLLSAVGIACILDGLLIFAFSKGARKNPKMWCGISLIITAFLWVGFSITNSSTVAMVLILFMGIGGCIFSTTCAFLLTANWWPTKKGVVLGWTTIGYVLTNIVWTPRVPVYYATIGMVGTHVVVAVLMIILAILGFIFVKNTPEEAGYTPDGVQGEELEDMQNVAVKMAAYKSPYTIGKLLKMPSTWTMALATGLPLCAAIMYLFSFFSAHLSVGYTMEQCALVMTVGGIVSIAGSWFFGVLDQKLGTKKSNLICSICILIALILCIFRAQGIGLVWIAAIILFCANGAGRNLLPSFVGTKYGRWDYAAAYQIIGTFACVISSIGTFAPAWFMNNYNLMYICTIVMMVVGIICNQLTNPEFIGKPDFEVK